MNKIIQTMHKETIAKVLFGIILFSCFSFLEKNNTDTLILQTILKDSDYQKRDSLYLINLSSNKEVISFYLKRNTVDRVSYFGNSKGEKIKLDGTHIDSTYFKYDTIIYIKQPIKDDRYVSKGKGINKKAEAFLKDTFDIKERRINWKFKSELYNVFPENILKKGKALMVSKPVFNLKNNNAIVFKRKMLTRSSYEDTIYLLSKKKDG